ncbi:MAG: hypothetical protein PUP91_31500 [Rhizonema sp. PD37]|nr:hypothetical protein [Rhizonema sp. PD37]
MIIQWKPSYRDIRTEKYARITASDRTQSVIYWNFVCFYTPRCTLSPRACFEDVGEQARMRRFPAVGEERVGVQRTHGCVTRHDITPITRAADTLNISFDGSQ